MMYFCALEDDDGTWIYDQIAGPYTTRYEAERVASAMWGRTITSAEAPPSWRIVTYECKRAKTKG